VIAGLPSATIEALLFTIVADDVMSATSDAIEAYSVSNMLILNIML
jgi:hypothetical protein